MKHRLLYMVIIVFMATSMAGAEGIKQLDFAEAVKLMSENNITLQIAEMNWEIAEIDYQKAVASNLISASKQSEMQTEHNLERAKNTYNTSKRNNYLEIFRAYTSVLSAQRALEIRELEVTIAEHDYAVVQEKLRIGDAGRLDDLQEMNRVESARRNKNTASQALAESERVLQRLLGLDSDAKLELATGFSVPEFPMALDESIELGWKIVLTHLSEKSPSSRPI